jgi:hypothetical protein
VDTAERVTDKAREKATGMEFKDH